jgi:hypothetical protein
MRTYILFFACGVALGCGSEESGGAAERQAAAVVGSDREALSFHEHCDTVLPDKTLFSPNSVISPTSYGTNQCAKAYVVVVTTESATRSTRVAVDWASAVPTTATECANMQLLEYRWDQTNSIPGVQLGSESAGGTWANNFCFPPILVTGMQPGIDFRYAISARQLNPDGSYQLRQVKLTATLVFPPPPPSTGGSGGR